MFRPFPTIMVTERIANKSKDSARSGGSFEQVDSTPSNDVQCILKVWVHELAKFSHSMLEGLW